MPDLAAEFLSEDVSLDLSFANAERVLYARITLPDNASDSHGHVFDYLVIAWLRCLDVSAKIGLMSNDPTTQSFMDFESLAKARLGSLESIKNIIMNYSGLVLNLEMGDCFPLPQKYVLTHVQTSFLDTKGLDLHTLRTRCYPQTCPKNYPPFSLQNSFRVLQMRDSTRFDS